MSLVRRVLKAVKAPFSKKKKEPTEPTSVDQAVAAILKANFIPPVPVDAASPAPLATYWCVMNAMNAQGQQLADLLYETRASARAKWRTHSKNFTTEQREQLRSEHRRNEQIIENEMLQTEEEEDELYNAVLASYVPAA